MPPAGNYNNKHIKGRTHARTLLTREPRVVTLAHYLRHIQVALAIRCECNRRLHSQYDAPACATSPSNTSTSPGARRTTTQRPSSSSRTTSQAGWWWRPCGGYGVTSTATHARWRCEAATASASWTAFARRSQNSCEPGFVCMSDNACVCVCVL